jgi:hypothetical protein
MLLVAERAARPVEDEIIETGDQCREDRNRNSDPHHCALKTHRLRNEFNEQFSDRSQPRLRFDLSLSAPAGSGALHRFDRAGLIGVGCLFDCP